MSTESKSVHIGLRRIQLTAIAVWITGLVTAMVLPSELSGQKPHAGTDTDRVVAMNRVVSAVGAVSDDYVPQGFTYETSTGKLWWSRLTKGPCPYGVVLSRVSITLAQMNAEIGESKQKDGTVRLTISCRQNSSCMQNWDFGQCAYRTEWILSAISPTVSIIDKTAYRAPTPGSRETKGTTIGPYRFAGLQTGLFIDLADDESSTKELTSNLKQIILAHGGKEYSAQSESLSWLTHHSWKSESEEHSDSQGCRTVDHRLTAITFSDDGQSLSLELFYYSAPTCSSKDVSTCRTDYKGKLERPPLSTSPPTIRFEAALEPIVAKCTSSKLRGETSLSGELEVRSVDEVRLHFSDESSGEWTTLKRVED